MAMVCGHTAFVGYKMCTRPYMNGDGTGEKLFALICMNIILTSSGHLTDLPKNIYIS